MDGLLASFYAVILALVFLLIRGIVDLRARRFGWGVASLIICLLLMVSLLIPIRTHAVKVDLPVNVRS